MMLKVEAIVREEKFEDVKSALDAISVTECADAICRALGRT